MNDKRIGQRQARIWSLALASICISSGCHTHDASQRDRTSAEVAREDFQDLAPTLAVGKLQQPAAMGTHGCAIPFGKDGETMVSHSDFAGVMTPRKALRVRSPVVATLTVQGEPQSIEYWIANASRYERETLGSVIAWRGVEPWEGQKNALPIQAPTTLTLNLDRGVYVLSLWIKAQRCGGQYGFLIEVTP